VQAETTSKAGASMPSAQPIAQASAGATRSGAVPPAMIMPTSLAARPARSSARCAARAPISACPKLDASRAARGSPLRVCRM
jgi:hypothetical protein